MIYIEGTILNQYVYVLIDAWVNLIYISPQPVEKCELKYEKFKTGWLVQLATSKKRKVTSNVR